MSDDQQYVSPHEMARRTGIGVSTLKRWRALGEGPPWYKLGPRNVVYDWREVEAWIQARKYGAA